MASLSKSYTRQKTQGQVYTPPWLVRRVLDEAGYVEPRVSSESTSVLDPACGDGRFLGEIVRRITAAVLPADLPKALSRVQGWDTDANAIAKCRSRLTALVEGRGVSVDWNLQVRNSLQALPEPGLFEADGERFDFVVGNPPYVRIQHLSEADRALIQTRFNYCKNGSTDLYIAFFELGLSLLKRGGVLGYITPNTYFRTAAGKVLRRTLVGGRRLRRVVDFGHRQVFPNATTYSAITVAANEPRSTFSFSDAAGTREIGRDLDPAKIGGRDGSGVWRLYGTCQNGSSEKLRPLRELASIRVGLATLADTVFIVQAQKEEVRGVIDPSEPMLVTTKRLGEVRIERGLLRPAIKGSRVKPDEPCHRGAYVIFPYDISGRRPVLITEDCLRSKFPLGYDYLRRLRSQLEKRDAGRRNPAGWYAFGRTQALESAFGEKIICPPMAKRPSFAVCRQPETTVFSGYFVKYDGNLDRLAAQLNSDRMHEYVRGGGRDYMGGWKGYSKAAFQDFPVDTTEL